MATTSNAQITVSFAGDVTFSVISSAAPNPLSPGSTQLVNLASGVNNLAVPPGSTRLGIEKPGGNTTALNLVSSGGPGLGLTDPDSFSLAAGSTTFPLYAASALNGVRLIWS